MIVMQIAPRSSMTNNVMTCTTVKSLTARCVTIVYANNSTSTYLISTAIANKTKARFYDEDLPEVENVSATA